MYTVKTVNKSTYLLLVKGHCCIKLVMMYGNIYDVSFISSILLKDC